MLEPNRTDPITIEYIFNFPDGLSKSFKANMHHESLNLIIEEKDEYPEWTRIENNKCPNCELRDTTCTYCPVAVNVHNLVCEFSDFTSYDEIEVTVVTEERSYHKKTSLQKGVASLLGLCMATSDCPIMARLKHMARFHLPFASTIETMNRILSTYLLAQHFREKKGLDADWSFEKLKEIYEEIRVLNMAMKKRLETVGSGDANINALVSLDVFAMTASFCLDTDALDEIENLFHAYYLL